MSHSLIEKHLDQNELKTVSIQLSCPHGQAGIEMANKMYMSNSSMILATINRMRLSNNDVILELGHGNCKHLEKILLKSKNITYHGLEVSKLMNLQAKNINSDFIKNRQACFSIYDGQKIPFSDNYFNEVMTVNTIYFWSNPDKLLSEIYRILKPQAFFHLAFAEKKFMQSLPFTKFGFKLYDLKKIGRLISKTSFKITDCINKIENIESKIGEKVTREYQIISLQKI